MICFRGEVCLGGFLCGQGLVRALLPNLMATVIDLPEKVLQRYTRLA